MSEQKNVGADDFALERVPIAKRQHWVKVAVQRFGQLSALSQFLLGAALGFGMTFGDAMLAILFGTIILEVVAVMTGILGQREGLSTSVLARWTGFGKYGSALISLVISLSLIGWFGIQSGVAADGLASFVPGVPPWVWAMVIGLGVTVIVIYGFESMAWTAYITIPAFLGLAGWSVWVELQKHKFGDLITQPAPGPELTIAAGATLVAGGFIVGMVITPDMTRFNRSAGDVVKQTVVSVTVGEIGVALVGVLLAHALKTNDIISIVTSTSGFIGSIIIVAGTIKMNDWNLYGASLGVVNFVDCVFGKSLNRGKATLLIGLAGSLLAAAGILGYFTSFLVILGVAFPPIAGIMVAEYYIVKTWRKQLSESAPNLPETQPGWVPATLFVWGASAVLGAIIPFGIASLNSLMLSILLYVIAGKLGLVRGTRELATQEV